MAHNSLLTAYEIGFPPKDTQMANASQASPSGKAKEIHPGDLTPKGRERPNWAFLILDRLPKLDNRADSCEILHNRVLPRVLANKTIFIKNI